MRSNKLDISPELTIYRFGNGIKLISPEQAQRFKNSYFAYNTGYSVESALKLPIDVYFYDVENIFQNVNEHCAETAGFESSHNAIMNCLNKMVTKESSERIFKFNGSVLKDNQIKIDEEYWTLKSGIADHCFSVKSPLYGKDNKLIGIFGCSIVPSKDNVTDGIMHIAKMGLLDLNSFKKNSKKFLDYDLSQRETDILHFTAQGKSAKEISLKINLSKRTIEDYLENLKNKFQVESKAELMEKIIELGI